MSNVGGVLSQSNNIDVKKTETPENISWPLRVGLFFKETTTLYNQWHRLQSPWVEPRKGSHIVRSRKDGCDGSLFIGVQLYVRKVILAKSQICGNKRKRPIRLIGDHNTAGINKSSPLISGFVCGSHMSKTTCTSRVIWIWSSRLWRGFLVWGLSESLQALEGDDKNFGSISEDNRNTSIPSLSIINQS